MKQHEMVGMILAGGRGSRLYELTTNIAKPAVNFGGKYRIIDFPLSNCANSGIGVVGVLTQYESILLNSYVTGGNKWGLDMRDGGVFVLPPRETNEGFGIYRGTADAIYQNVDFIDQYNPDYVVILSGDHIYKMNYDEMLNHHKRAKADATIAVLEVTYEEATRFGIMNTDSNDRIIEFEEKPKQPKSNLASMGIYIFNWPVLRKYLLEDAVAESDHDFGKNIIPNMLKDNKVLSAWRYLGYWKDVGTIDSLWEANMDLLDGNNKLNLYDPNWKIFTEDIGTLPHFVGENCNIKNSLVNQGTTINGTISNSVIFYNVDIKKDAKLDGVVAFPGSEIGENAIVNRCIIASGVKIGDNAIVGDKDSKDILLVSTDVKDGERYV